MRLAPCVAALAVVGVSCGSYETILPPPGPRAVSSSSGSTAIVVKGGRVFAYVPGRPAAGENGFVTIVDVSAPGRGTAGVPARAGRIDLGPGDAAQLVAGDERAMLAASGNSRTVWFIDPLADRVTGTLTLDASFGASDMRGPGAPRYVNGIVVEPDRGVAYLAVWNGIAVVDLARREVVRQIVAPQAEHIALDPVRRLLFAPFYNCPQVVPGTGTAADCGAYRAADGTVITDGLNAVRLDDGAVFTYRDPLISGPAFAAGSHPDAAASDSATGAVVVPMENALRVAFLDMTQASFQAATGSFTAPRTEVANVSMEAVAAEPASHWAFFAEAFGSAFSFADLATPLATAKLPAAAMPDLPGAAGPWHSAGDPHPAAAARVAGRPVGLLPNAASTWVARVDLQLLATLPHADPAGWTKDEAAPAVTFLDASSP